MVSHAGGFLFCFSFYIFFLVGQSGRVAVHYKIYHTVS